MRTLTTLLFILLFLFIFNFNYYDNTEFKNTDEKEKTSIVKLSTRSFDLRTDASIDAMRREKHFIPLNRVKWLQRLISKDKYLRNIVLHIRDKGQSIYLTWPSRLSDKQFPIVENIPEQFQLEGFQTRSSGPKNYRLLLLPIDNPHDFQVVCTSANEPDSVFCSLIAPYEQDENLFLMARIYFAKSPYNFRQIAIRMKKIAQCLDVTESLENGTYTAKDNVEMNSKLPELSNCFQ